MNAWPQAGSGSFLWASHIQSTCNDFYSMCHFVCGGESSVTNMWSYLVHLWGFSPLWFLYCMQSLDSQKKAFLWSVCKRIIWGSVQGWQLPEGLPIYYLLCYLHVLFCLLWGSVNQVEPLNKGFVLFQICGIYKVLVSFMLLSKNWAVLVGFLTFIALSDFFPVWILCFSENGAPYWRLSYVTTTGFLSSMSSLKQRKITFWYRL